jgi:hypothetical protein
MRDVIFFISGLITGPVILFLILEHQSKMFKAPPRRAKLLSKQIREGLSIRFNKVEG